jgi:hypothetical protein
MPLKESRRDLDAEPDMEKSPPPRPPVTLSESSLATAQTDSSSRIFFMPSAISRACLMTGLDERLLVGRQVAASSGSVTQ